MVSIPTKRDYNNLAIFFTDILQRHAELDAHLRQKPNRFTKKRQLPKTISQKFSGFWRKKTVRGGMWADGDNIKEGYV